MTLEEWARFSGQSIIIGEALAVRIIKRGLRAFPNVAWLELGLKESVRGEDVDLNMDQIIKDTGRHAVECEFYHEGSGKPLGIFKQGNNFVRFIVLEHHP